MNSHRPHRPSPGPSEALAELRSGRAVRYAADAADACIDLFTTRGFQFSSPERLC